MTMRSVSLKPLVDAVEGARIVGADHAETLLSGMTYDSRQVAPGTLFIAVPGEKFDGSEFIPAAVEAGAAAVVVQADRAARFENIGVPRLIVPDARKAMAPLACAFYDNPTHKLHLAGVTGTNGKTTTTLMIDSIARAAGDITGTIGTLGATVAGRAIPHDRTTPEAPDLQRYFAEMLDAGAKSAAMEVASHALVLGRTEGCAFDVGVFTNLTQDHLDFHGTMEAYRDAKELLFTKYAEEAQAVGKKFKAVLNANDDAGWHYECQLPADVDSLLYAAQPGRVAKFIKPSIVPENVQMFVDRITYTAKTPIGPIPVEIGFGGTFNVANSLAAVGYGVARGLSADVIAHGLASCKPIPGRFQPVRVSATHKEQDFAVLVDYAHTPDGLDNVLRSARPLTQGRLIVVFGCGGNRDRTKRPKMGRLALELADVAVVTSDNPRKEEPEAIIDEILTGMDGPGATIHRDSDRRAAIAWAVQNAQKGDTVVIAGKGHEDYQILADRTIHFSDVEVAEEEIQACLGR
jgi:UDP-N-acetylmuramoyl-L-alanyl-D-glutamate--2,6-diaminopimelate ligase